MASSDDEIKISREIKETDNAPLFVSVYVVVLAFFIVLNSMSKVDQSKLENLVESVNQAFNMPTKVIATQEKEEGSLNELVAQFFNDMESWAKSILTLKGLDVIKKGNSMLLRIPTDKLFEDGKAEFTKDSEPKVKELARVLSGWMQNFKLSAEIVLEIPSVDTSDEQIIEALAIARMNLFAKTLTDMHVSSNAISPGIRKASENYVVFRFVLHATNTAAKRPSTSSSLENH